MPGKPMPMTSPEQSPGRTFEDVEREHLRAWIGLSTAAKNDFFEEMIELAYRSSIRRPRSIATAASALA